jgi:hypothetical protein
MSKMRTILSVNRTHKLASAVMRALAKTTFLDGSFNRGGCWDRKQEVKFMTSLITGQAPSKIIIANIQKCLEQCIEGSNDYDYFNNLLLAGYLYVAIDGNNRTNTIVKYLNGQIEIEPGEYELPDGVIEVKKNQTTFKTHPPILLHHIINNIDISICEYVNATRADLSRLFICINNGVQLNPQELRNAILVPFAKYVRDTVVLYETALDILFGKGNLRMKYDELIVTLAVLSTFGPEHGISKKDKDNCYEDNSTVYLHLEKKNGKKDISDALTMVKKYAKKGFTSSTLMNLMMLIRYMNKSKIKILDDSKFFSWFQASENRRVGDWKRKICTLPENQNQINYAGTCASTRSLFLEKRFEIILEDFKEIPSGLVTDVDSERIFSKSQRYQAWVNQDGKCPRTNKQIPEDEINNHDIWAADHIHPYSKGGKTTLDNLELVCRKYNQSKGNKTVKETLTTETLDEKSQMCYN